jgi:mannose-6-phosphate isomerase-like protein (cupin superfamily)
LAPKTKKARRTTLLHRRAGVRKSQSLRDKSREASRYSYATSGVIELPNLNLPLDEATLGGKELEMAEITFPTGTVDDKHQRGSVEIFYVLSGKFGHEVNGELHWLTRGNGRCGEARRYESVTPRTDIDWVDELR